MVTIRAHTPYPGRRWILAAALTLSACPSSDEPDPEPTWQLVHANLDGALLSVWGTGPDDVWAVGSDTLDGQGPLVIRYDGESWERIDTGLTQGDLWWVFGFADGPVYMGGAGGIIVRHDGTSFEQMETPGDQTVFGIWGSGPEDVWAVGGASDATGGFAWRLEGDVWVDEPTLPAEVPTSAAIWKIHGVGPDDAWLVGSNGVSLHWNGTELTPGDTGVGSSLFTVFGYAGGSYVAVGGLASGVIVENTSGSWENVTPDPVPQGLAGVSLDDEGSGLAVGLYGTIYTRDDASWERDKPDFSLPQNLHGSWVDPAGGMWAVGGQTLAPPLREGVLLYRGVEMLPTEGL